MQRSLPTQCIYSTVALVFDSKLDASDGLVYKKSIITAIN